MTVIVGVCRKYLINKHLVFRTDLYFPVGIKKIPVLILMKLAEPFFPVASVNYGIGISKILIVVIFRINTAILILVPIYVMAQIKILVLCRLQDGKTDIRTGNFQPCIGFCIYRLKRLNIRRAVFLKEFCRRWFRLFFRLYIRLRLPLLFPFAAAAGQKNGEHKQNIK